MNNNMYKYLKSDYEILRRKKNKEIEELKSQRAEFNHIVFDFLTLMDSIYRLPNTSWVKEFERFVINWRNDI